jgi:hypothetical protein
MPRKEALSKLMTYFDEQMSAVNSHLPSPIQDQRGEPDDWSAKDNLFHALEWANKRLDMLETFTRGDKWEEVDYGDYVDINREIFDKYRDRDWEELLTMIGITYQRGAAFLESASEESLEQTLLNDERPIWRILADNLVNHPMIHIWEILVNNDLIKELEIIFGADYADMLFQVDSSQNWQGGVHYNQACLLALCDKPSQSIERLEAALLATPQLVDWAKQDPDLITLRTLPEYQDLFSRLED